MEVNRSNSNAKSPTMTWVLLGFVGLFSIIALIIASVAMHKAGNCSCNSGSDTTSIDRISGSTSFNAFTTYWEAYDEANWKKTVADDIKFEIDKIQGSARTGKDNVWSFRMGLSSDPNGQLTWTNTYDSYFYDPDQNTLLARMISILRNTGETMQVGWWTCKFNSEGKISSMSQKVIWASWLVGYSNQQSTADKISGKYGFNAFTTAWENYDETTWKSIVADDINFGIDQINSSFIQGKENVWAFRKTLQNGTNSRLAWTNTYSNFLIDPSNSSILHAQMTSYIKATGQTMQLGKWVCEFNQQGRIRKMRQNVLWASWLNSTSS